MTEAITTGARAPIITFELGGRQLAGLRDPAAPGGGWVLVRRVCEHLRIDTERQLVKLKSDGWSTIGPNDAPFGLAARDVPMWLASISPSICDTDVRPILGQFQTWSVSVLWQVFGQWTAQMKAKSDGQWTAHMKAKSEVALVALEKRLTELEESHAAALIYLADCHASLGRILLGLARRGQP